MRLSLGLDRLDLRIPSGFDGFPHRDVLEYANATLHVVLGQGGLEADGLALFVLFAKLSLGLDQGVIRIQ
jgi:hypothetical protein